MYKETTKYVPCCTLYTITNKLLSHFTVSIHKHCSPLVCPPLCLHIPPSLFLCCHSPSVCLPLCLCGVCQYLREQCPNWTAGVLFSTAAYNLLQCYYVCVCVCLCICVRRSFQPGHCCCCHSAERQGGERERWRSGGRKRGRGIVRQGEREEVQAQIKPWGPGPG